MCQQPSINRWRIQYLHFLCRNSPRSLQSAFQNFCPCMKLKGLSSNSRSSRSTCTTSLSTRCCSPKTSARCARLAPKCSTSTWVKSRTFTMTSTLRWCLCRRMRCVGRTNSLHSATYCCRQRPFPSLYDRQCSKGSGYINHLVRFSS